MTNDEARSKAYFLAAGLIAVMLKASPEAYALAAEQLEISQADMEQVRAELQYHVAGHMRLQGFRYWALALGRPGKREQA